jgi:hypothetical protein
MISKVQVKRLSIIKSIYFHFALPIDSGGMARVQTEGRTIAKTGGMTEGDAEPQERHKQRQA